MNFEGIEIIYPLETGTVLVHDRLNKVTVVSVNVKKDEIEIKHINYGVIPHKVSDFGTFLFFTDEHKRRKSEFKDAKSYFKFCIKENDKKLAEEKRIAEETLRKVMMEKQKVEKETNDDINTIITSITKSLDNGENILPCLTNPLTIKTRGIKYLVHFTDIENLNSILKKGIVPRRLHPEYGINAKCGDGNNPPKTSLSVEYPNYLMLYNKKKENRSWVLLYIDVNVLTDTEINNNEEAFEFYKANSAINANNYGESVKVYYLNDMFPDSIKSNRNNKLIYRKDLGLEDRFTTDPQAEILANVVIPSRFIKEIAFNSSDDKILFDASIPEGIKVSVKDIFATRKDFPIWCDKGGYASQSLEGFEWL